jgi:uncharacterized protein YjbI with pentapeptide repeats
MATEDKSSLSSDQKELNRPPDDQMEKISKQLRKRGYKIIVEYDDTGQPSKLSGEIPPRKTWWDWLDLLAKLAIPLVVVLATIGFGWWQVHLADSQHQQDQQSALDQQQATILQTYIDNIQDLLVNHQLYSKYDFEIIELAQARSVAVLSKLDPKRKGIVVQFLRNSGLIGYQVGDHKRYPALISLDGADLTNADLTEAFLEYVDFSSDKLTGVILTNADLTGANLSRADLSRADLSGADLSGADLLLTHLRGAMFSVDTKLSGAYLSSSDLSDAVKSVYQSRTDVHLYSNGLAGQNLSGADLSGADLGCYSHPSRNYQCAKLNRADLSGAYLTNSDLSGADLSGAHLREAHLDCYSVGGNDYCAELGGADLSGADLSGAKLNGADLGCYIVSGKEYCANLRSADLSGADLSGAKNLTQQYLDQVYTCKGAILPKGITCNQNK